jgi:acetyl-CoA synthetase
VRHLLVYRRLGREIPWTAGRDRWWHEAIAGQSDRAAALPVEADRPCLIIYTSGTTGRPKGAVLTHGGFLIKTAHDFAYCMDVGEGDRLFWLTDLGWLMGPMAITAALFHGGTAVMFEGVQDYPRPNRLWSIVERHRISVLGISPTAVRALMPHGPEHVHAHDLSSLRILGSTGEPWNPEPYRWLHEVVGGGRCPIINCSGGTEVGACFLSPTVAEPIKTCSLGGPALGMAMDVVDVEGRPVRGEVGELVCRKPFPGMTRGFWRDPERYLDTYWRRLPGIWVHGDWASVDEDGYWFLHGRSDDTLNIAGKRVGPAELESAVVGHPSVAEAAAVGVPHEVKGESAWIFCVLVPGVEPSDELVAELRGLVAAELGKAFAPERILFVAALPKTRSAKIVRRAVRAKALGTDPGDLSSLENPEALDEIEAAASA